MAQDSHAIASTPRNGRLNGWKEIAAHLGKGVRTVQRWEARYGLPIHRFGEGEGEIVVGFADEIDTWQKTTTLRRQPAAAAASNAPPPDGSECQPDEGFRAARAPEAPTAGLLSRLTRPGTGWVPAGFMTAAAIVIVVFAFGSVPRSANNARLQPAHFRIAENTLIILDELGGELWRHRFDPPISGRSYTSLPDDSPFIHFVDLEGDKQTEVLFIGLHDDDGCMLYCFNADGSTRFTYQFRETVRFGAVDYSGPFWVSRVFFTPDGTRQALWVVSVHRPWFPSLLQRLDNHGHALETYWSNGYVTSLGMAAFGDRRQLLVGAANNESKGASLAVFDGGHASGSAPAANPHYRCTSCEGGTPSAFFVFPAMDIVRETGGISYVSNLMPTALSSVISIFQGYTGRRGSPDYYDAVSFYTIDPAFRVVAAEPGDNYPPFRSRLVREGILLPAQRSDPESQLFPVRRWHGDRFVEIPGPER